MHKALGIAADCAEIGFSAVCTGSRDDFSPHSAGFSVLNWAAAGKGSSVPATRAEPGNVMQQSVKHQEVHA
jgi:hypothetical protein